MDRDSISINDELLFSNVLGAIGSNTNGGQNDILGAIGTSNMTPSTSPQTNSSTGSSHCVSSLGAACGRCCDMQASSRCLDCNDVLCEECSSVHSKQPFTKDHCVIAISKYIQ